MSYGENVIGAEDRFQTLLGGNIEDYNQTAGSIKEQAQEKQAEGLDKWKTTEGLGGDLIGVAVGAPIVAKGVKAIKTVKGLISRGKDVVDSVSEQARGLLSDATESATNAAEGLMSRATQSAQRLMTGAQSASTDATDAASSYASGVSDTVESAAGTAETSFGGGVPEVASGLADAGADAAAAGAEAGVEAGGELAAGVLGAIPVVGEAALIGAGAFALGDSLYHLFKHKDTTPPVAPPPVSSLMAPPQLTSKFADAIPSFDTATDRSGASSAF